MIEDRTFAQLGGANHEWLNAKHHFSFASYYDIKRMNWGQMRVWSDDTIQPHTGFPHRLPRTWKSSPMWVKTRSRTRTTWGNRPFLRGESAGKFITLVNGLVGDDIALPIGYSTSALFDAP